MCSMSDLQLICLLEEETLILATIGVLFKARIDKHKRRSRRRRWWTRPWLLRRPQYGQYECLMAELAAEDLDGYRNFQRIPPDMFHEILERVGPSISRKDTFFRKALGPGLRLAITLRYLATGNSYISLQYGFRVANNTISRIIPEVCEAIVKEYISEVMTCPTTPEEWRKISEGFSQRWNFHNTIGALDGKHIAIRKPAGGGSWFFNYKGFHSIILMALVDADYKFIYVDVGANGRCSDGGVFRECSLRRAIEDETIGLPDPAPMPNDDTDMPYKIVADDAFPMKDWLMKPFPHRFMNREQRIYNYRLSRARRVVENAFGILAHRFRCLLTTFQQNTHNVESIVMCCCILHNFMRIRYPGVQNQLLDREDQNTRLLIPGSWRDVEALTSLQGMKGNHTTTAAKSQRKYLMEYYNSPAGRVAWQDHIV